MMTIYRTLTAVAVFAVATVGGAIAQDKAALVSVVTSPEPQTQLMAMVLTTQAVEQGHATRMLLCGPGGDLALMQAPDTATAPQPPRGASPQAMLQALMARGVTVEVCAIYLPGLGADAGVLLNGVGVAQPPAMAAAMLATGAQVWSF